MLSRYKKDGKIEPYCQDVILNTWLVVDYDPFFIFKILDHFHYLLTDPRIYAITRITWYFHKIRRVLISHIKLVKGGCIQFQARGYRNSSVKKVRINKQPGRFLRLKIPPLIWITKLLAMVFTPAFMTKAMTFDFLSLIYSDWVVMFLDSHPIFWSWFE